MLIRLMAILLVAGVSGTALAQLQFFTDRDTFRSFMRSQGVGLKGLEDFEENDLPPSSVSVQDEPLDSNPNVNFPDGLTGLSNLSMTTNRGRGLALLTNGFLGAVTDIVGANFFSDYTTLTFTDGGKDGVGLDLVDLINGAQADIRIFDTSGGLLGSIVWPSPFTPVFFGVASDAHIGRIELEGQDAGGELVDNIEGWVPEPASLSLFALGGLALLRRR